MADLTDKQAAQSVKIVGADTSGVETTPLAVDNSGNAQVRSTQLPSSLGQKTASESLAVVNASSGGSTTASVAAPVSNLIGGVYLASQPTLTDGQQIGVQVDQYGRLLVASATISALPAASFSNQQAINTGVTYYATFTVSQKLAIKQFYAGGKGIGKQTLARYSSTATQYINSGNFELTTDFGISTDTNKWYWTSVAGTGSIARSNTQFYTGAYSAALTFSNSSGNNAQGVKQTFTSAQDITSWRYITAQFYNVLAAGGGYTRTISIILTDSGGNTRTYSVSGASTASPFNTNGWIKITGEIENPTSATGIFDATLVASIELRMNDSANKSGTVYWDTVQFEGQLSSQYPIYHAANTSFNLILDPVLVLNNGDEIVIIQANGDTTRKEYFGLAGGVSV